MRIAQIYISPFKAVPSKQFFDNRVIATVFHRQTTLITKKQL
jgi:hypothetical protein